jgi:NADPH2:quinone reductase
VLIFGASGAVGTMAVQFAVQRGAHVLGTASGKPAHRLRALGVSTVIDARDGHFDTLRSAAPIDAVLALAGGPQLERCLDFVRPGGIVAHPNGIEPVPQPRRALRIRSFDAVATPAEFTKLNRRLERMRVRIPIAAIYPLARAAQAHRRLDRGHVLGRMALRINGR